MGGTGLGHKDDLGIRMTWALGFFTLKERENNTDIFLYLNLVHTHTPTNLLIVPISMMQLARFRSDENPSNWRALMRFP